MGKAKASAKQDKKSSKASARSGKLGLADDDDMDDDDDDDDDKDEVKIMNDERYLGQSIEIENTVSGTSSHVT